MELTNIIAFSGLTALIIFLKVSIRSLLSEMTLICLIVEGIWLVLPELLLISMNIGLKHKVLVLVFLSTLAENKRTCVNFIKDFLIASTS